MTNMNLTIDKTKCTKCGLCIKGCDSCILEADSDGYPSVIKDLEEQCIGCQHCLASCPTGAFSIFGKSSADAIANKQFVDPQDLLGLIKTRRSCRRYKQQNVPQETIDKLKEMLAWAPTGCNDRGLHFCMVEDIEIMHMLSTQTINKVKKISPFIPSIGLIKYFKELLAEGKDPIYLNAPHMIVACINKKAPCKDYDPIIALSYFELYANSLGLGTTWCGIATGFLKLFPSIRKYLNIPSTHKLAYVMLFGLPDIKFAKGTLPDPCGFSSLKSTQN